MVAPQNSVSKVGRNLKKVEKHCFAVLWHCNNTRKYYCL